MAYFDEDFLGFFRELAENNHKGWFDANRKRYEKSVKEPFRQFIRDLIEHLRIYDRELLVAPKDVVFRINRDIRFAKDKSPYKTHAAANIARGGRKDEKPGFYIHFGADTAIIGGGVYAPDSKQIQSIRELITEQLDEFQTIIQGDEFKSHWGAVQGEQNKRIPKDFKPVYEKEPVIANKQFYVYREFDPEIVLRDDLPKTVLAYYTAIREFNSFMEQAFK